MRVLLVEDEKSMAEALQALLRMEKYETDVCADGITGGEALESGLYDLAVLDVMLPGKSGLEVIRQARQRGIRTPVLMLTARGELEDMVAGLDGGADDYMTKPFRAEELLARLRALGRRARGGADGSLSFGDIVLDTRTFTVRCTTSGQSVRLGEKEYRILEYFLSNQGQILRKEQLALKIWGYDSEAEYNKVEVYLTFTRKKLIFVGSEVEIKAVRGLGYELRYRYV